MIFNFFFRRTIALPIWDAFGWDQNNPKITKCTKVPFTTKVLSRVCGSIILNTNENNNVPITLPIAKDNVIGSQSQ